MNTLQYLQKQFEEYIWANENPRTPEEYTKLKASYFAGALSLLEGDKVFIDATSVREFLENPSFNSFARYDFEEYKDKLYLLSHPEDASNYVNPKFNTTD